MKHLLLAGMILNAGPALAWNESQDFRGLKIYEATGEGISLSLVCDPEGAMIPPENHLMIKAGGETYSGEYKISTADREFEGTVQSGTMVSNEREAWDEVIAVLKSGSELNVSINGMNYAVSTGEAFAVKCGTSEE